MTTERLFEFLVLSQTLSYSKAAKKLFITQSALSRHIIDMERELGVELVERSTHGVRLTHPGRMLAHRSRHLIQRSEAAISRVRTAELEEKGSISIACLESTSHGQLMIFLSHFVSKFGELDIKVDTINDNDRLSVLERYDFTFTAFELQNLPQHVVSRVAFRTPGVLYVLADHGNIKNHHIRLEELGGETLFVPYADEVFSSYAVNRQLAEKLTGYKLSIVKVPTVESALLMTALGKGVTIMPQHMPQSTVANVLSIDISTPECMFDTYMYWNSARQNPAAKLLLDELNSFTKLSAE